MPRMKIGSRRVIPYPRSTTSSALRYLYRPTLSAQKMLWTNVALAGNAVASNFVIVHYIQKAIYIAVHSDTKLNTLFSIIVFC